MHKNIEETSLHPVAFCRAYCEGCLGVRAVDIPLQWLQYLQWFPTGFWTQSEPLNRATEIPPQGILLPVSSLFSFRKHEDRGVWANF